LQFIYAYYYYCQKFLPQDFSKLVNCKKLIPYVEFILNSRYMFSYFYSPFFADLWNFGGIFRNFNISTAKTAKINSTIQLYSLEKQKLVSKKFLTAEFLPQKALF